MSTEARLGFLAAVAVAFLIIKSAQEPDTTAPPPPVTGPAGDLLAALPVAPENATTRYDRDEWGDWASHANGCDTRELVLTDQAAAATVPGKACRPLCPDTGPVCWVSPYDGAQLRDPAQVDIDHRVPLAEAARSGAANWTQEQREAFYNDPTNLVAVSASSNASKGDDDPARWRPADQTIWCGYAGAYITTKATYGLSVDPAERAALAAMLATCPVGGA